MNIQALVDGMNAQWQRERAGTQMTLGEMISQLEAMPADTEIDGIDSPHSYRGYYCDLAFERIAGKTKVIDALTMCKEAMGKVFEGYKGGEYVMGALTPLWLANYGCCGEKIIAIRPDGTIDTADDDG